MRFSAKIRHFFGSFLVAAAFIFYANCVNARSAPDCGNIKNSLLKDVYSSAQKVYYLVDVQTSMDSFCTAARNLEQWDKELSRSQKNREYKKQRDALLKSAEVDLQYLKGRLIALRGWSSYESHDSLDEAVRRAKIKKEVQKCLSHVMRMKKHGEAIELFMQNHNDNRGE